jgi:Cu-Zn family superoxide dismutase
MLTLYEAWLSPHSRRRQPHEEIHPMPKLKSTLCMFAAALVFVSAGVTAHAAVLSKLKVQLHTSQGADAGSVTFKTVKKGLKISVTLKNIPDGDHAMHIHVNPKCDAPDFKTAGGHFNPEGKKHGMNNPMGHHAGDMPQNITVGEDHIGTASFTVDYLSLDPTSPNSLFTNGGTSIIIHEKADDMMTDPTGNAGNRIACGVILAPTM